LSISPREQLRRVPRLARVCALVAFLNAVCWSLLSPPFQVPDEPEHVAYVKVLAEAGRLPTEGGSFTPEEAAALRDTRLQAIAEQPEYRTVYSPPQLEKLHEDLETDRGPPEAETDYGGVAASEPPLYYALQAIPYTLAKGATLLDRIQLMRLLSALMCALTAMFTYLFVREALPRVRWAWTVAGLAVALVPLLGFMSGAVNPDSMLYAVTAAVFFCLARGFRLGLTRALALALGAAIAVGLLTKLNFAGIAPGALLGLVVLSVRAARVHGRAAYVSLALALSVALSPVFAFLLIRLVSGASSLGIFSGAITSVHDPLAEASYIWQMYLPRLPGMHNDFPGLLTTRQIWFDGYVGLYGWIDTPFPGWVYEVALILAVAIALLCARTLVACSTALRARAWELAVYGAMAVGLLVLVGGASYVRFPTIDAEFGQVRYMLPMLPLLGAALALAARGAGRRWGPVVGALIIMLFFAHDVFSQFQELARYYG
jgi:4-amino-4-deoxy-L-arabinose transferase-like glycosyltransferase